MQHTDWFSKSTRWPRKWPHAINAGWKTCKCGLFKTEISNLIRILRKYQTANATQHKPRSTGLTGLKLRRALWSANMLIYILVRFFFCMWKKNINTQNGPEGDIEAKLKTRKQAETSWTFDVAQSHVTWKRKVLITHLNYKGRELLVPWGLSSIHSR